MNKVISLIDYVLSRFCIALMAVLLICVVWQVFSRYILGAPSTSTDELARFLFIWVGLMGAAYTLGQKRHLAIDYFVRTLEGSAKKVLQIVIASFSLLFASIIMIYGGLFLVSNTLKNGQVSPALGLEMGWVYTAIPLSGVFMVMYLLKELCESVMQLRSRSMT